MVIVKEDQPIERDLPYARIVFDNMVDRKISYQYLFSTRRESYSKIVLMLRSILASRIVPRSQYSSYADWTAERIQNRFDRSRERIIECLDKLRPRLFIRFSNRLPFDQFCIHSATNDR